MIYLAQESGLILGFSYMILLGSTQMGIVLPQTLMMTAGLLLLLGIGYGLIRGSVRSPLAAPLMLWLAVGVITSILSMDPRRSFSELWLIITPVFLAVFFAAAVRRGLPAELVTKTLLITGGIVMLFSLYEAVTWYAAWLKSNPGDWLPDMVFRLSLPNFMAVLLNLLLMPAVARWLHGKSRITRWLLGIYIAIDLLLIYLTSSRGGWMGTAAGLAVLFFLYFGGLQGRWWEKIKPLVAGRWVWIALAGLLGLALLGFLLYQQLQHPTHGSLVESRGFLWQPSWEAFLQSPLTGKGLFTYASLFATHYSVPPRALFIYSHNIYLDALGSTGLPGFLSLGWLVIMLIRQLLRSVQSDAAKTDWSVVISAAAVMAAFLVHGLVDSVHHTVPTCLWVLCILLGTALGTIRQPDQAKSIWRTAGGVGLAVTAVVGAAWLAWTGLPMQQGAEAANREEWQTAVSHFEVATQRDPTLAPAWQQLGLANAVLAADGDGQALTRAIENFEQCTQLDPLWAPNWLNLAVVYQSNGEWEQALTAYDQAVALAPRWSEAALNRSMLLEHLGRKEEAEAGYIAALEDQDDWLESPFWEQTDLRRSVKEHKLETKGVAFDVEAALAENPTVMRTYLPVIDHSLKDQDYARVQVLIERARLAFAEQEENRLDLNWYQAEVLHHNGDLAGALSSGQQALQGMILQGIHGPGTFGAATYTYQVFRREGMAMELVPQVTIIHLPGDWPQRAALYADWCNQADDRHDCASLVKDLGEVDW